MFAEFPLFTLSAQPSFEAGAYSVPLDGVLFACYTSGLNKEG